MTPSDIKVTIGPNTWPVVFPDYATRQDLAVAWAENSENVMALRRVAAAAVGLCTRVGRLSKADYGRCKCDPLVYGGAVFSYLHEQGVTMEDTMRAGMAILSGLALSMAPSEPEVEERAGFTGPPAADSTGA